MCEQESSVRLRAPCEQSRNITVTGKLTSAHTSWPFSVFWMAQKASLLFTLEWRSVQCDAKEQDRAPSINVCAPSEASVASSATLPVTTGFLHKRPVFLVHVPWLHDFSRGRETDQRNHPAGPSL